MVGLCLLIACGDNEAADPDATIADAAEPDAAIDAPPDAFEGPGMDLPIAAEYQELADHLEAWRVAGGIRNASFLIMQGGEIVFAHGFGDSGRGDGFKAKATSLYRIASLTKMLTATVALQDVAADRIDLDAPITTYLPHFDLAGQPGLTATITPRQLLSHQSGLRDYLPPNAFTTEAFVDAYLTGAAENVLYQLAPSGAFFNYSNTGFYYAGLLTQRAGTQLYREAMQDRLFTPLGMTRTTFLPADVQADGDFAVGVSVRSGMPRDVVPNAYDNTWARPAAHAFSSVIDLAEFVRFLRAGNPAVLPDAERTLLMTPQVSTKDYYDYFRYAFGLIWQDGRWVGDNYHNVDVLWHDGLMPGFRSELMWVPELDFAFIALAGDENAEFWQLEEWVLARYTTLPPPTTPPDIAPDFSRFPAFAGEYFDPVQPGRRHHHRRERSPAHPDAAPRRDGHPVRAGDAGHRRRLVLARNQRQSDQRDVLPRRAG